MAVPSVTSALLCLPGLANKLADLNLGLPRSPSGSGGAPRVNPLRLSKPVIASRG